MRKAREFKRDNIRIGSAMPYSRQVWNPISPRVLITFWLISHGCPEATARGEPSIYWGKLKLLVPPGKAFYHDDGGENLLRFCFAKEDPVLDEACRRLERLKI
jgi:hypothetical protein